MRRRKFLASIGAGSTAMLAGCSSTTDDSEESVEITVTKADVAGDRLQKGGWKQVDDWQEQVLDTNVSFVDIAGVGRTTQYENHLLRQKLREGTLGNFDATVMQFFTSRIELDPGIDELPWGIGLSEILGRVMESAEMEFKGQMKDQGLQNIQEGEVGQINTRGDSKAWMKTYGAQFQYDRMEFSTTDDKTIEIPANSLNVWGILSVWKGENSIFVAGGACPGEEFHESFSQEVTDLITVTVDIDLGLQPEKQKRKLQDLIRNVQ